MDSNTETLNYLSDQILILVIVVTNVGGTMCFSLIGPKLGLLTRKKKGNKTRRWPTVAHRVEEKIDCRRKDGRTDWRTDTLLQRIRSESSIKEMTKISADFRKPVEKDPVAWMYGKVCHIANYVSAFKPRRYNLEKDTSWFLPFFILWISFIFHFFNGNKPSTIEVYGFVFKQFIFFFLFAT